MNENTESNKVLIDTLKITSDIVLNLSEQQKIHDDKISFLEKIVNDQQDMLKKMSKMHEQYKLSDDKIITLENKLNDQHDIIKKNNKIFLEINKKIDELYNLVISQDITQPPVETINKEKALLLVNSLIKQQKNITTKLNQITNTELDKEVAIPIIKIESPEITKKMLDINQVRRKSNFARRF